MVIYRQSMNHYGDGSLELRLSDYEPLEESLSWSLSSNNYSISSLAPSVYFYVNLELALAFSSSTFSFCLNFNPDFWFVARASYIDKLVNLVDFYTCFTILGTCLSYWFTLSAEFVVSKNAF